MCLLPTKKQTPNRSASETSKTCFLKKKRVLLPNDICFKKEASHENMHASLNEANTKQVCFKNEARMLSQKEASASEICFLLRSASKKEASHKMCLLHTKELTQNRSAT